MTDPLRTVTNPSEGGTITFLETSEESGGARMVATITLAPGGSVRPHSHRVEERFQCVEGTFRLQLRGTDRPFEPGEFLTAAPHELHGFRNDTDSPATLTVTATPAGDLDRILRTLAGLTRDGLLEPGKPPKHPLAMASLAWRGRYYEPPMPRWLYMPLMAALAPLGKRTCDRLIERYTESPS